MQNHARFPALAGLALLCGSSILGWGATPSSPNETVAAFNAAISERRLDAAPGGPQPLTSDLTTHVDGSLAVVWVQMRTRSEPQRGLPALLVFSETYLLRREQTEW